MCTRAYALVRARLLLFAISLMNHSSLPAMKSRLRNNKGWPRASEKGRPTYRWYTYTTQQRVGLQDNITHIIPYSSLFISIPR